VIDGMRKIGDVLHERGQVLNMSPQPMSLGDRSPA
jgi:hypothetical protein